MTVARPAPTPTPSLPPATVAPSGTPGIGPIEPPAAGITFRDFVADPTVVRSPTTSTAQSKLWFNDGRWWGALFGTTDRLTIFTLDPTTQVWADTGTLIDERPVADADMLSTGAHLWAVSGGSRPSDNHAIRVRRFTYDPKERRYIADADFPVTIRPSGASPAVIAIDSTDTVWVAYVADGQVWVSHTLSAPLFWSSPVALPVPEAAVDLPDVASIVAYGPGRIGVAWTNQRSGVYFSSHDDGAPEDAWSPAESILPGALPDPQLNVTTYPTDPDGTGVVAAVATTADQSDTGRSLDALTLLAARDANGLWQTSVFGLVRDRHTRPIVLVDPTARTISVAATSPGSGGAIYYKRTSLDRIEFDTGVGQLLISDPTDTTIDNVTAAKGALDAGAGLLALASDRTTGRYFHGVVDLGGGAPAADPADPSRPTVPTAPPKGTTTSLMRDTFEGWPIGPDIPAAWYAPPEAGPGHVAIVGEGPSTRALRVSAAGAGVRACRDIPEIPRTTLSVSMRVRVSRISLEDATILSARGSGGEAASLRVTNKGVVGYFNGSRKTRTTAAFRPRTWYRVSATIDQVKRTYSIRVTTDSGKLVAKASGLRWRMSAVRSIRSICVDTAPAPPSQALDIAEVRVTQVVTP
jgi:hypothetical protein